uniref:7TM GPCR serpentine receptor class x (Srx) domain-containing protein n=1 Tax=Strongyloides venezuelensis TaxID=75913 RepID=A0A0K0F3M4_STRVS
MESINWILIMYIKFILFVPVIFTSIWLFIILRSLLKEQFYHLNFRCLICCIIINGLLYFLVEVIGYLIFLIMQNNIVIHIQSELKQSFIMGGCFYPQIFIIAERLIAIIFVKKYESHFTNVPHLGIFFIIVSYAIYLSQKYILGFKNAIQDYMLVGTIILSAILSFIYFLAMRNKLRKKKTFSLKFYEKSLSTKYQTIENERSFSLSTILIIIFFISNVIVIILNLSFLQKHILKDSINYNDNFIVLLCIVKYWGIIILLIIKEQRIKNNIMKIFGFKSSKIYEVTAKNTNGDPNVEIHVIPQSKQQYVYFNGYQKQWYF